MEEWIWYMAPVAVAVLAYLMDVRAYRRHEADMDAMRERFHNVEMAYVKRFGDQEKSEAIQDKTLERHEQRLDVLEGAETGVPKDEGERLRSTVATLSDNIVSLAIGHNELKAKLAAMAGEDEEG